MNEITITLGWWLLPLTITIGSFVLAIIKAPQDRNGDWDFFTPFIAAIYLGYALIVSLIAWLVWSLFN